MSCLACVGFNNLVTSLEKHILQSMCYVSISLLHDKKSSVLESSTGIKSGEAFNHRYAGKHII